MPGRDGVPCSANNGSRRPPFAEHLPLGLETRPTAVFFVPTGALLARIVEQSLRYVLPDRVAAIKSDRTSTVWISTVRSQRRQETGNTWRWISVSFRCRIRTLSPARGSLSRESQYSGGSASSGASAGTGAFRAASAANFSICLGVGMRQLAGRSVEPWWNAPRRARTLGI